MARECWKPIQARIACRLQHDPKDVQIAIESRGPMNSNEMRLLRRLVDMIDATDAAGVADSEIVLGWMEEDLRARLAVPVEPTVSELR
jgi:hypothetical protein